MRGSFDPSQIVGGVGIVAVIIGGLIGIAVAVLLIYLVYNVFRQIPEEHRTMQPGLVWLLLIPCFSMVWNFFVYPKMANSFKSYFDSVGDESVGDCGKTLAWIYAGCVVGSVIPYLGSLLGIAALVMWIIFIVKAYGYKKMIVERQASGPEQAA